MGGRGGPGRRGNGGNESSAPAARSAGDVATSAIRQAVALNPGIWGLMSAVRANMAANGISSREDQDRAIGALVNSGAAQMIPMANLKALPPGEREAALRIGGENKHLIRMG